MDLDGDEFYENVFNLAFKRLSQLWIIPEQGEVEELHRTLWKVNNKIDIPMKWLVIGSLKDEKTNGTFSASEVSKIIREFVWIGYTSDLQMQTQLQVNVSNEALEKARWKTGNACQVPLKAKYGKALRIDIGKSIVEKMKMFMRMLNSGGRLTFAFETELMRCNSIEELAVKADLEMTN